MLSMMGTICSMLNLWLEGSFSSCSAGASSSSSSWWWSSSVVNTHDYRKDLWYYLPSWQWLSVVLAHPVYDCCLSHAFWSTASTACYHQAWRCPCSPPSPAPWCAWTANTSFIPTICFTHSLSLAIFSRISLCLGLYDEARGGGPLPWFGEGGPEGSWNLMSLDAGNE